MRDLLEEWFTHVPEDAQLGLRQRFRQDDSAQHIPAFWELYIHEAHRRLGFDIEYEPSVPGTTRRPDFLMRRGRDRYYLECALVSYPASESAAKRREDILLDLVDEVFSADLYVRVSVAAAGQATPRRSEIVDRIEEWLAEYDWEDARGAVDSGVWEAPERTFTAGGSMVILTAHPKPPHRRGDPDAPMIWAGPGRHRR